MDIGVGLWCMRSTAYVPASPAGLYRDLVADALLADDLGLHSLWLSEHHGWYDGWCPSPLVAAGAVLGATRDLHVGTGVFLLPLHDPARVAAAGHTLHELAPGRTELGIGLGYRDAEFDAVGVSRTQRGRRADAALGALADEWADGGPRIWVGGIANRAVDRAVDRGLSLFLPSSMRRDRLRAVIDRARETAVARGTTVERVGVLKDAWVTDGGAAHERNMRAAIGRHVREYGGAWWLLQGRLGFEVPEFLDRQVQRTEDAATVGTSEAIAAELRALAEIGVDLVVLQIANDFTRGAHRDNMERIATEVVPALA